MEFQGEKTGDVLVLAVCGRMDTNTSREFDVEMDKRLAGGEKWFALDLAGLQYISSAGLRSILLALKRLAACRGKMACFNISPRVSEVFSVSGFANLLPLCATREEALDKLRQSGANAPK